MRLVVKCVLCGVWLIVAGCQPAVEQGKNETKVDEVAVVPASNPKKTDAATAGQTSLTSSTSLPSATKWKNASAEQRVKIAQQLVSEKLLIGLSEDAVDSALGNPNRRFEQIVYDFHVDVRLRAELIPGMIVNFGRNGLVQKVGGTGFPKTKIDAPLSFDKDKWLKGNDSIKLSMAQSVWNDKVLDGKNREQVYETLGKPSNALPIMLFYKCGLPVAAPGEKEQKRSKTLSIWLEKGSVVNASLED